MQKGGQILDYEWDVWYSHPTLPDPSKKILLVTVITDKSPYCRGDSCFRPN